MSKVNYFERFTSPPLVGDEGSAYASLEASKPISHYMDLPEPEVAILWLWPTEMEDADQQSLDAIGISAYESDTLEIVDAERRVISTSHSFQEACRTAGLHMRSTGGAAGMALQAFEQSSGKGNPLPFNRIVSARFVKKSFPRRVTATFEMFDGLRAVADIREMDWGFSVSGKHHGIFVSEKVVSHSTSWIEMEGGGCILRRGRWMRTGDLA